MIPDPTVEIKRIRHELGADVNFDLERIFAELRRQQENSDRVYVQLPNRPPTETRIPRKGGEPELARPS